jgi:hypothetical protein
MVVSVGTMAVAAVAMGPAFPVREVVDLHLLLMHILLQPGDGIALHPELSGDGSMCRAERT